MKHFLILAIAIVLLSCTKNNERTTAAPTIVGVWGNTAPGVPDPTFTADKMQWDSGTLHRYYVTADSLYIMYPFSASYPNGTVSAQFHYSIDPFNTILTLTPSVPGMATVYTRLK